MNSTDYDKFTAQLQASLTVGVRVLGLVGLDSTSPAATSKISQIWGNSSDEVLGSYDATCQCQP